VNFIRGISTDASRVDYDQALKTFMDYRRKTDPAKLLKGPTEKLEDHIMDFIADQKQKVLSYATIRQRVAAIKHFYEMNRRPLSWKIVTKTIGKPSSKKDRGYTHQEIAKMLTLAKPREQAAILLMASGGLRIGALPDLRLKHLKKIDEHGIYRVLVYENSEQEYCTFTTPEAAAAIDRYLLYRTRYGEKLDGMSPLLRGEFDRRDREQVANVKVVTDKGLRTAIGEILVSTGVRQRVKCLDAGTKTGTIRHEVKIAHGFKKFCATNMIRAKVEPTYREYMLSHKKGRKEMKVDQLDMVYDRPQESDLLSEYLKAVNLLTIDEANKLRFKVNELEEREREMEKRVSAAIKEAREAERDSLLQEIYAKLGVDTSKLA